MAGEIGKKFDDRILHTVELMKDGARHDDTGRLEVTAEQRRAAQREMLEQIPVETSVQKVVEETRLWLKELQAHPEFDLTWEHADEDPVYNQGGIVLSLIENLSEDQKAALEKLFEQEEFQSLDERTLLRGTEYDSPEHFLFSGLQHPEGNRTWKAIYGYISKMLDKRMVLGVMKKIERDRRLAGS